VVKWLPNMHLGLIPSPAKNQTKTNSQKTNKNKMKEIVNPSSVNTWHIFLFLAVLFELRASRLLCRPSTIWATHPTLIFHFLEGNYK
jgi:hypothetical protein